MRLFLRWTRRLVVAGLALLLLLVAGLAAWGVGAAFLALPRTAGTVALGEAVSAPVTLTRDRHGVPVIRADTVRDATVALGYAHAQDRLWQMEAMRRLGAGRLAEVIGAPGLGADRFMRTLRIYRRAEAQIPHLAPETREALDAYAAGVNAFLETRPGPLPAEFQLTWLRPEPWRPADTLVWQRLMGQQLAGNWSRELLNARLLAHLKDPAALAFVTRTEVDDPQPITVTQASPVLFEPSLAALSRAIPPQGRARLASNAWAVGSAHSAPGVGALLASDPHLGFQAPILWYLARIETPGLTLEGATVPGVPFVLIGHNTHVAWGITTTHSDTQDLYRERPTGDGRSYQAPDGPRPFTTRVETLRVRLGPDQALTVRETRHGPVVSDLAWDALAEARATLPAGEVLALASATLAEADTTPDALLRLNQARDLDAARAALDAWEAPQQNVILADRAGRVAMLSPGRVPVRAPGHDGRLPAEGWTGAMDWRGWVPREALPRTLDPPEGRVLNANNRVHPTDWPHPLAVTFPEPWRAERLAERLRALDPGGTDADAMAAIQGDAVSPMAVALLPAMLETLEAGAVTHAEAPAVLDRLRAWDPPVMDRDRPEPLILAVWLEALTERLFADDLGPVFADWAARARPLPVLWALTEDPAWCDDRTTGDRVEECGPAVAAALDEALAWIAAESGGPVLAARWGDWHRARFGHGLFRFVPGLGGLTRLEVATDGGDFTLNRGSDAGWDDRRPFAHRHGPGLRMVVDLGPPACGRFVIATGQSGNPVSAHYGDRLRDWADGTLAPIGRETCGAGAGAGDAARGARPDTLTLAPGR
ncbi:penicillin acylase family protein [Roseospira visakhapatnamensis]|uniref:Penicillin amidase n=1 Tax=Roseospira visakhapatnamensis TaxID=390880 RepID=A0A7W6RA25_9PROT|nr:penicillin acylase family protein [Roseospira visakhapatnamensis]MBB4264668.1 penicillin amidase [Roseospira visakhapatnamensis]